MSRLQGCSPTNITRSSGSSTADFVAVPRSSTTSSRPLSTSNAIPTLPTLAAIRSSTTCRLGAAKDALRKLACDENVARMTLREAAETFHAAADQIPLGWCLHLDIRGRCDFRRISRQFAVTQAPAGRRMRDNAQTGGAFRGRDAPMLRRRLDQHGARDGPALANIFDRRTNASAAAGGHIAPGAFVRQIHFGRDIFRFDMPPVRVKFIRDKLRQPGQGALAHFRPGDSHDRCIVGMNDSPDSKLRANGGPRRSWPAKRDRTRRRERRCEEETAVDLVHGAFLMLYRWRAAPRTGRRPCRSPP